MAVVAALPGRLTAEPSERLESGGDMLSARLRLNAGWEPAAAAAAGDGAAAVLEDVAGAAAAELPMPAASWPVPA